MPDDGAGAGAEGFGQGGNGLFQQDVRARPGLGGHGAGGEGQVGGDAVKLGVEDAQRCTETGFGGLGQGRIGVGGKVVARKRPVGGKQRRPFEQGHVGNRNGQARADEAQQGDLAAQRRCRGFGLRKLEDHRAEGDGDAVPAVGQHGERRALQVRKCRVNSGQ